MTIYALSSGPGISGVAVIRVSGENTSLVIKPDIETKKIKIIVNKNPEIDPNQVLFGLILGKIFLLPNLLPRKKANVSHIQTDKNNK